MMLSSQGHVKQGEGSLLMCVRYNRMFTSPPGSSVTPCLHLTAAMLMQQPSVIS